MSSTEKIKKRYDRIASCYDWLEGVMAGSRFEKWMQPILRKAKGKTLEAGIGTGRSIPYYPKGVQLTAIDFSPKMLKKAEKKFAESPIPVKFMEMDVQHLEFPDNSFDTVVTSCVFCSVPDPVKGLKEIRRVLKPGGQLLMLEHMRSHKKFLGKLMDWLNFIPLNIWGANINRETLDNLKKAGFSNPEVKDLWMDIVKQIRVTKY
ncbi:class I SAM-dependent methyltransferase [Christiangramia crocea]|uniref:Class I SAM-dependent methyltransferase n=1 Tax=Christiangramia crocea TaxID=2904124 RepID=A0A9X1UWQ8_9FLAO|nr:class I SAM-dependent methyltransferase [Gramella crocea]MCG9971827.1 class I SAM-dependent methyltransferase [Gramella crocea]